MSIKVFLVFIIGITTTLNASLGNGIIDGIKIKKVENQTIFNQEAIKDAIYKYVRINKEYPNDLNDLIVKGVLTNDYNNNAFNGDYSISIDKQNKELKITTSIDDNDIRDYFQRTLTNVQRIDKIGDSIASIYSIPTEISDIVFALPLFGEVIISETTAPRIQTSTYSPGYEHIYQYIAYRGVPSCYLGGSRIPNTYNCLRYVPGSTSYSYSCQTGYTMKNSSCIKITYSCEDGYTLQADNTCKLN